MKTYDLSHSIQTGMPVFPGDPPVECDGLATVSEDGYRTTQLHLSTHTGTHVDAPAHMLAAGETIDDFPAGTFRFLSTVVDCSGLDPRTAIDADRLCEGVADTSPDGNDLIVVRTGWDRHWGTKRYADHPFLTVGAAEMFVEWGCHVGVDVPNVDPTPTTDGRTGESTGYPAHDELFAANRLIVENLRGLDRLPVQEPIELHAYPLPVTAGDAAPVRAVALV